MKCSKLLQVSVNWFVSLFFFFKLRTMKSVDKFARITAAGLTCLFQTRSNQLECRWQERKWSRLTLISCAVKRSLIDTVNIVSHKQGKTVGLHSEHLFKLMGQVGRCVKCRAASVQFPPQVKEEILRKTKRQVSLHKRIRRPSGPFRRCDRLLGKHVKTAFYDINMYKYITNTRADRRNWGKHRNNNKKHNANQWKTSQTVRLGPVDVWTAECWRSNWGAWVAIQQRRRSHWWSGQRRRQVTSQCNGSLFLLRQMLVLLFFSQWRIHQWFLIPPPQILPAELVDVRKPEYSRVALGSLAPFRVRKVS